MSNEHPLPYRCGRSALKFGLLTTSAVIGGPAGGVGFAIGMGLVGAAAGAGSTFGVDKLRKKAVSCDIHTFLGE